MDYYPLFLDLKGKQVLVVGGGPIALEKIVNLLKAGACITVVAEQILPQIRRFSRRIRFFERAFELADITPDYTLVFGATGDHGLNQTISRFCAQERILCNAVDDPANCHFIVPAIVRRGRLTVAVSTAGVSPLLAKSTKEKLKNVFGRDYTVLTRFMADFRKQVFTRIFTQKARFLF